MSNPFWLTDTDDRPRRIDGSAGYQADVTGRNAHRICAAELMLAGRPPEPAAAVACEVSRLRSP